MARAGGLLLWTDKRWRGDPGGQARFVMAIDRLNAAVLAGAPIAIAAYF